MLDWLIIGGGVIGTTLSNHLLSAGVPAAQLRVLDPHPTPLARWTRLTQNTGMRYLRSPQVHHIDLAPLSLFEFGKTPPASELGGYILPYTRPAYALFQAHVAHVVAANKLDAVREQGSAQFIMSTKGGYTIETDRGALKARRVVLSIGRTALAVPAWARTLQSQGAPIQHIFEWDFSLAELPNWEQVVVVGGGITGGQVALSLTQRQPASVTLLTRHPLRQADFDSSPCWLAPTCGGIFRNTFDPNARRQLIREARNKGTLSADVARDVKAARKAGALHVCEAEVRAATWEQGRVTLTLSTGGVLRADRVLLASGFDVSRPGGAWVDELIDWFGLPVANCGYPIVDAALQWRKGLHVAGALAELELGPPSANIVGGRLAAQRLVPLVGA